MTHDDLERILSAEIEIVPSSGFAQGVMDAVRREASGPPPIPFPWSRALPTLVAGALALAALIVLLVKSPSHPPVEPLRPGWITTVAQTLDFANMYGFGWVMFAILVTLAGVTLSMRLTTGTRYRS